MKLTGAEIANSGGSKYTQDVVCPWCLTASTLDLGPQHVHGDLGLHCRKCAKFSMHKTADKWFDQHQDRMDELKDVWKKIPSDAYMTCRQHTKGTPWVYTLYLGGAKRPEEFGARDTVEHVLIDEYGMSYKQAHGLIMSAVLTPGQRIYLQRHTRLVMAAEAREEMKRTGATDDGFKNLRAGHPVRVNGHDGIFLRWSSNEGFAIVALPTPGIGGFGDAEVPAMELEVIDAGGPEVAEDFEFDKLMDDPMGEGLEGGGGLEEALEHLEQAEEIVEDLVMEDGGDVAIDDEANGDVPEGEDHGDHKHEEPESDESGEGEEKDEGKNPFAANRRAALPIRAPGLATGRPGMDPNLDQRLRTLQQIIQDPQTDPQTLQVAQEQYTNLKRQIPARALGARDVKAFFGYKSPDDMKALERPDHKTNGPKLTDTKLKGDSWVPRNDGDNPNPKEDKNLEKTASREAQRRVHTHFSHSGDLKRAIECNRPNLGVEDIREICKFYANTGKMAHYEADELAFWFIGDKPRLLSASDKTASPRYEQWKQDKQRKQQGPMRSECTCKGAYDRYCPEHGAQDSRASKEEKHTCDKCGESWTSARKPAVCPYCDGKKDKKESRRLCAADEAGTVEVKDSHPESGLNPGSGGDVPDPKWQKGDSANSVSGPEKKEQHGTGEKTPGEVKAPDLGVPKGAALNDRHKFTGGVHDSKKCPGCKKPGNDFSPDMSKGSMRRRADEDEGEDEGGECGQCGGPLTPLGALGKRKHYRCRNCGMDSSKEGSRRTAGPGTKVCSKCFSRHPVGEACTECAKKNKAASMNRQADGICQKCGTPLDQAGACPTCQSSAGQQQSQNTSMQPTTARRSRLAARHKDGCGCGFCESMRSNVERKKPKEALASGDMQKVAHDGIGIFTPAMHKGNRVLVIAIDNTSLRATVQDGSNNQWQVDVADLEPVKTGPYSGFARPSGR